jgi:hypothetical protein
VDISLPNGPGVNEREFVIELCNAFDDRVHILVPKPKYPMIDTKKQNFTFSKAISYRHPLTFMSHQLDQIKRAGALLNTGKFNFIVSRVDFMPLALYYVVARHKLPLAIKTASFATEGLKGMNGIRSIIGNSVAFFEESLWQRIASRAIAIDACKSNQRKDSYEQQPTNPHRKCHKHLSISSYGRARCPLSSRPGCF